MRTINFLLLFALLIVVACKKDKDPIDVPPLPDHESEIITTVKLEFTDPAGVNPTVTATFRDPDGVGGAGPDKFDTIRLASSSEYQVKLSLLNESVSPAEDITQEVVEEADEHIVCYTSAGAPITIIRTDTDGTHVIGIDSKWTTSTAGTGSVKVTLKHQPGTKDGSCAPGETDVEVNFTTEVQ